MADSSADAKIEPNNLEKNRFSTRKRHLSLQYCARTLPLLNVHLIRLRNYESLEATIPLLRIEHRG